jgi:polyisoprenoid-binding protein YceI
MFKKIDRGFLLVAFLLMLPSTVMADNYRIDTKDMHAFIQFRVQHLGYSWLYGRFNRFKGTFSYDEASPEKAALAITIETKSIDSNHAERDKHLRGRDFLDVYKFPQATFISTRYIPQKKGKGVLQGNFTLHGITKPLSIAVTAIGAGNDPWGGYRRGFEGKAKFKMADFGLTRNLGAHAKDVELILSIEGTKLRDKQKNPIDRF